ncbi:macrophage metalloelastase-like isoform X2 [Oculina patagonica]
MRGKFYIVVALTIASVLNCVLCAPTGQTRKTASFLLKFGYLGDDNDKSGGAVSPNSEEFRTSIRKLQRFGNIPVTGRIDAATIKLINTDRCGVKDPSTSAAGKFTLQGTTWKRRDITYRILNFTRDGIPSYVQRRIFRNALNLWQSASGLTIREVYGGDADILISFVTRRHGDPYPFDRKGGTLAHAFYPHSNQGLSGDAHFDDDEFFTTRDPDKGVNLDWVAVHEFGHSLGLEHSNVRESIMYPWYKGYHPNIQLTSDDIQGIQALYPKPTARKVPTPATKKTTTKATTTTKRPPVTPRPAVVTPRVTPRPAVVTPRVTPRPEIPNLCSSTVRYDTVFVGQHRRTYFVVGNKFWTVDRGLRRHGPWTLTAFWRHVKTPVDAAYLNGRGNIVFFKGSEFWEYNSARTLRDSGNIERYGLPSTLENMDAVFTWEKNQKPYFFKDKQYWRYNEYTRRTDLGYPRDIRSAWGLKFPVHINAAVKWLNGRNYVFQGKNYVKIQSRKANRDQGYLVQGYPKVIAEKWMKCNTGVGALGTNSKGRGLDSDEP